MPAIICVVRQRTGSTTTIFVGMIVFSSNGATDNRRRNNDLSLDPTEQGSALTCLDGQTTQARCGSPSSRIMWAASVPTINYAGTSRTFPRAFDNAGSPTTSRLAEQGSLRIQDHHRPSLVARSSEARSVVTLTWTTSRPLGQARSDEGPQFQPARGS